MRSTFLNKAFEGIDLVGWHAPPRYSSDRAGADRLARQRGDRQLAPSGRSRRSHRGRGPRAARRAGGRPAAARRLPRSRRARPRRSRRGPGRDPACIIGRGARRRRARRRRPRGRLCGRVAHRAFRHQQRSCGLGWRAPHLQLRQRRLRAAHGATEGGADSRPRRYACAPPSMARLRSISTATSTSRPPVCRAATIPGLAPAELRARLPRCLRPPAAGRGSRAARGVPPRGRSPPADLVALIGHALLREDAGFHMVQNLEAAAAAISGLAGRSGSGADFDRRGALSRRPFADAAGAPPDRAGRAAVDAGWGGV